MNRHTPTREAIVSAVSKAFRTTEDAINSKSRKRNAVEPREVCIYLMRTRAFMKPSEIALSFGISDEKWIRYSIRNTMGLARLDSDFAFRIWEAEKIILGITEKINVSNPL